MIFRVQIRHIRHIRTHKKYRIIIEMNPELYELLKGAGLEDIVIPRKEFIDEHKHLISLLRRSNDPALRKEASSQKKELEKMTGGFSKASGFIRRLMAENKKKHGDYRRPVWPLAEDSTMNQPWKFKYYKIANTEQDGVNNAEYGASPFIQSHFGNVRAEQEDDDDDGDNAPPPPPRDEPIRESQKQRTVRRTRFGKLGESEISSRFVPSAPSAPSVPSSSSTPMGDVLPDVSPKNIIKRGKDVFVRMPVPTYKKVPVAEEKQEAKSPSSEKEPPKEPKQTEASKPAVSEKKEEKASEPAVSEKDKKAEARMAKLEAEIMKRAREAQERADAKRAEKEAEKEAIKAKNEATRAKREMKERREEEDKLTEKIRQNTERVKELNELKLTATKEQKQKIKEEGRVLNETLRSDRERRDALREQRKAEKEEKEE